LTGQEYENTARGQAGVDFGRLFDRFCYIVREGPAIEVNSYWVLSGCDVDDGRRRRKQGPIFRKVADAQSRRHDDQPQGLNGRLKM
jgi:hypothetical protein